MSDWQKNPAFNEELQKASLQLSETFNTIFSQPWVKEVAAVFENIQNTWAPYVKQLNEQAEKWQTQFDLMTPQIRSFGAMFERIAREEEKNKKLENAGWLPHETSPFELIDTVPVEELSEKVRIYYLDNWEGIKAIFLERSTEYVVDDEAKATFREALEAHTKGLYRVAPRLLFPELERVARVELNFDALKRLGGQDQIRRSVGHLMPYQYREGAFYGMNLYDRLTNHLYANVPTPEILEKLQNDPVPNRHASIHGLVVYSTMQNSLNMIIMADFFLQVIAYIRAGYPAFIASSNIE